MREGTGRRHSPAARTTTSGESRPARDARLVAAAHADDEEALRLLVDEHRSLVERIARSSARSGAEVDDLVQEGTVGLLKAIRRYEPDRGVPFEAYATTLISGEIRHHLRDRASCLRLPEPVRELRSRLGVLREAARAELGREATIHELATRADVSEELALEAVTAGVAPLDDELPEQQEDIVTSEVRVALETPLDALSRREQHVVYYRFFADLTQQEIADLLGISQMHVSRLLRGALETMRTRLDEEV